MKPLPLFGTVTLLCRLTSRVSPYSSQNLCEKDKSGVQWHGSAEQCPDSTGLLCFAGWVGLFFFSVQFLRG